MVTIKMSLWGQRTWVPRPILDNKPMGPAEEEKRPRMTKEDLKLLGEIAKDHHVLSELVP